ncbi:TPA: inverse autotransporter beta domain-containing protein [Salmonella enterica subsp. enterica serovar Orientalis]|nr:inverse autotransporter beta domain-containing protein [Salmonella enterica]HEC9487985.1 inverse autotransporter beta domain-containing protein [Salmonella enterica subsp. enterica serovar Orientalis]
MLAGKQLFLQRFQNQKNNSIGNNMMNTFFSGHHRGFHMSIWTTLLMQTLIPLVLSLTPIMVARAELRNQNAVRNVHLAFQDTRSYVLKPGETVEKVARQYGLTMNQLKRLNQFRVFRHGFNHLKAGDELDVPLKSATAAEKQKTHSAVNADDAVIRNGESTLIAGYASQAGSFIASDPDEQATAGLVKGMAVSKANQTVQEWMSQFGTAQVQLDVDDNFSLKHSSLNLLHPWYDTPENMVFSQTGIHRTDNRTQANLGAGYRHFRNNEMFGTNIFLDYDLSRDHARVGFGGEYWRNFMKLSANAYVHLSGWKVSPDIEDYDERPANGWDIRAEGYLPSCPQLGAKVAYEQYYGNEVALFGADSRQKDPHAVTVGVSYTPVPLLTLSFDRKTGQNSQRDTEFQAKMNYRIGEPLSLQLDPDAVASARSLMGSRYDLIDRNNNIVLEYRKQDVIKLHVPERVTGFGGQVIPLTLNVKAKHGLKDIIWDDAALLAAGGKLIGNGTQWVLTLPAWKPNEVNAWDVMAVAHDTKGNASKPAEMQIVVTTPKISAASSMLTLKDYHLLADGQSQTEVNVVLSDATGQPVTGLADQIKLSGVLTPDSHLVPGALIRSRTAVTTQPVLSTVTETSAGHYRAILTSGTVAGSYQLNAQVLETALAPATVIFEDTQAVMANSTLTSDKTVLAADGLDTATVTLTLKDVQGLPVSNEQNRLRFYIRDSAVPSQSYNFGAVQTQEGKPGQYTVTFSGTLPAQHLALGVKINGKDSDKTVFLDVVAGLSVSISGNPVVGEELKAATVCNTNCSGLTYQWVIEDKVGSGHYVPISGATQITYKPVASDQKRRIEVTVNQ